MTFFTLRDYLNKSGETQEHLAERLGVSQSAVSQWLNGKTKPSLEMAGLIETLTGVPCRAWLSDSVSGEARS